MNCPLQYYYFTPIYTHVEVIPPMARELQTHQFVELMAITKLISRHAYNIHMYVCKYWNMSNFLKNWAIDNPLHTCATYCTCAFEALSLLALMRMPWYLSALSPSTFTRQVLGLRRAVSVSALLSLSSASLTAMMAACMAASSTDICGQGAYKCDLIYNYCII